MASVTVKGPERPLFFSVKGALVIAGNRRVPSVCYPILESERKTIESLAADGKAVVYRERVRFISGKAHSAADLRERAGKVRDRVKEKENGPVIIEKQKKQKKEKKNATVEVEPYVEIAVADDKEFSEAD